MLLARRNLVYRSIAVVYLFVLNTQIWLIEPTFISPVKVGCMAFAPVMFFLMGMRVNKAFVLAMLYWLACYLPASFQASMRFSTIGYLGMFVIMFIVYYTIVYEGAFTLDFFMRLLRWLILAYSVFVVLQQVFALATSSGSLLINLLDDHARIGKYSSLSCEPSHSAVILAFAYLCYLRCLEMVIGHKPSIKGLFKGENQWVTIGFLWSMTTMGSGSAYLALMALAAYFVNPRNAILAIGGVVLLLAAAPSIDNEQLNRATKTFEAVITGDTREIVKADFSGATRIVPLINTFTKLDLADERTWLGHGTLEKDPDSEYAMAWTNMAENDWFILYTVRQYGLIAFVMSIVFVYACCIRKFWSVETLLWFTLGMATIGNVYFHWGTVMMMATVRYFQQQQSKRGASGAGGEYASLNHNCQL